jgi:hypothetical protein
MKACEMSRSSPALAGTQHFQGNRRVVDIGFRFAPLETKRVPDRDVRKEAKSPYF